MAESACLEFWKAFAGPLATVVASAAAVAVTVIFNSRQLTVAKQQAATAEAQRDIAIAQRDIAYDKLKHDLFEKRYAIYIAARTLIERIFRELHVDIHDAEVRQLRLQIDEARFFFPPDTRALCEHIDTLVVESVSAGHIMSTTPPDYAAKEDVSTQKSKADIRLAGIYGDLAKHFERDLKFDQLTKP